MFGGRSKGCGGKQLSRVRGATMETLSGEPLGDTLGDTEGPAGAAGHTGGAWTNGVGPMYGGGALLRNV